MLELQDSMNSKVNADWRSAGNEWYRAIWMEASEMLEHYGWKWWKKQEPEFMQVKLEVVDIVHFALSIRLEQNQPLDETAELIAADFANSMQAEDIRKTIECLALVTLTDQGAHFTFIAGIMKYLDMSFDETSCFQLHCFFNHRLKAFFIFQSMTTDYLFKAQTTRLKHA